MSWARASSLLAWEAAEAACCSQPLSWPLLRVFFEIAETFPISSIFFAFLLCFVVDNAA
jgi:hypothetical protein